MERLQNRTLLTVLIALLIAFTFMAGEIAIAPQSNSAWAQRQKRTTKDKAAPEQSGTKAEEQKSGGEDDLSDILGRGEEKGGIDIDILRVENDVKLTSPVGMKIDESIEKLLIILAQYQDPLSLRRLAEFYWKKAHQLNLDWMQEHQKKIDAWFEAGQQGEPPKEPDAEAWHKYNRHAVLVCRIIIDQFPDFNGMDEVYYFIAYNLNEIEQSTEGVKYYKRLVKEYPESGYVPDAWMAIGDYYFSNNNVYEALPAYEEVLKFAKSKVFGYAKYKIAWCYFNLGKSREAIDTFKEVVDWSQKEGDNSKITLIEEALKDLVMAYAEAGSVDEAEAYFKKIGGPKYFRMMLVKLATIYTDQGKMDESIMVYRRLINDYPLHKENPEFQIRIVEAYTNKGNKDMVTKEILNMVEYAKPATESKWVAANIEKEAEIVDEAWTSAERLLIRTVVDYHKEALKTSVEETWNKTQQLYEIYIQYFGKATNYYDVCFNYSELLYKRSMWQKAGEWYTKVAEMDRKGKHFEDASYSAILAYEKLVHVEIEQWIQDTKKRSVRKEKNYKLAKTQAEEQAQADNRQEYLPREMSQNTAGFIKACELYTQEIPGSQYRVDIIYKTAIIYYAHNHFEPAVKTFNMIVDEYPTHRLAEFAANLILDSLNMKQDWRQLNAKVRDFLKRPKLVAKPAFRNDLIVLNEKSSFKKVEVTEGEKLWVAAAEEYMVFYKEFPQSVFIDQALYNASVHYVTGGELYKSIDVQKMYLADKRLAKSPIRDDVMFNLGKNYEALAYYDKAADQYEAYSKEYSAGKHVKDAIYNAAIFHENLGHTEKAMVLKQQYLTKTTDEAEKDQIRFQFAFMYWDVNDFSNAEKYYREYLNGREKDITWPHEDAKTGEILSRGKIKGDPNTIYISHYQLITIMRKQNRNAEVDKEFVVIRRLASCDVDVALGEVAKDAIAESEFLRLKTEFKDYEEYKLVVSANFSQKKWNETLLSKLETKSKLALELSKKYEKIMELKSARWTVASLYMIGEIYKYYSLALFNSEMPYWLTMDQEVIYQDGIQRRAEPVERKAIEGFVKCVETANKTGVYGFYVDEARMELIGYMPDVYYVENEIKLEPGFESDSRYVAAYVTPDLNAAVNPAPVEQPAEEPAETPADAPAEAPAAGAGSF